MPLVPEVPTLAPGIASTGDFAQIRDAVRFLQRPPLAMLRQTSAQSLANATSVAVQLNAEDVDSDVEEVGGHDNSTNNTRWTARYAGWHWVAGGIGYDINSVGYRSADLGVNGVFTHASSALVPAVNGNSSRVAGRGILVWLDVGDYIELYAFQTSTGALNTGVTGVEQSHLAVHWVSL